jgi:hypothetical protein
MRSTFLIILFSLFLHSSVFADGIFGSNDKIPNPYKQYFKVTNVDSFPGYKFYNPCFVKDVKDTIEIQNDERHYEFVRYPAEIEMYARNLQTGALITKHKNIQGCYKNETVILTIEKIENDSIFFKRTMERKNGSETEIDPGNPFSKLMILISISGLLIYCAAIYFRKKSLIHT